MADEFEFFVANAIAYGELDRDDPFKVDPPEAVRLHLLRFNREVDKLINQHGVKAIGKAVWFLYGCVGDLARDALEASHGEDIPEFYDSIIELYDKGFAANCDDFAGHSDHAGNDLATACLMLWDMDSGLNWLTFHGRPDLFSSGVRLVEFGLRHDHAAVQESFLHCLGHLHAHRPKFCESKIDGFLIRPEISNGIREYAMQCRTGMIM